LRATFVSQSSTAHWISFAAKPVVLPDKLRKPTPSGLDLVGFRFSKQSAQ
jgi:hypothetical protein